MHKQLRAALAVEIVVLIIALGFSVAYFRFGQYRSSHILDVLLVVLWVLVAAVLLVVFRARSLQREEMVRRFFISDDWVYNYEIGYAPLASIVPDRDPFEFATFAAESLALMSYGFEVADPPTEFQPKFLIASTKFRFHLIDGESSTEDVGAVVDEWAGTLQKVETRVDGSHSYTELGKYENVEQLAQLLYVNGAMVSSYDEALFADDSQCQETDGLLLADVQGGAAGPAAGMATSFDEVFDEMFSSTTNAFQNISPTSAKGATTEGGASE